MPWDFVAFVLLSAICVICAGGMVAARNPVHSVLYLILAFVNAAGLFMLLGAEFLAMLLVVVYVGAVAVLFLFVVMMLDVDFAEFRQGFLNYLPIGALIGFIFAVELLLVVGAWVIDPQIVKAPVAGWLLIAYGGKLLLQNVYAIPFAMLRKELRFDDIAKARIVAHTLESIARVVYAMLGLTIWCWTLAALTRAFVFGVIIQIRHPFIPKRVFQVREVLPEVL